MPRRKDARACGVFMFGADWRAEPTLMLCSEGARLLWFEMLLLMAESEKRGFLLVNGKRPSPAQIAALTRTDATKARERLEELESNGVFSRDGDGAIYSRRMVRDLKNRANGALGGNPSLRTSKGNGKSDNPDDGNEVAGRSKKPRKNGLNPCGHSEIGNGLTQDPLKRGQKGENRTPAKSMPAKDNPGSVKPLTPSSYKSPSPNGEGGDAAQGADAWNKRVWSDGVALLGEKNRSLVGKARKAFRNDDLKLWKVLQTLRVLVETEDVFDPVTWFLGAVAKENDAVARCGTSAALAYIMDPVTGSIPG